MPENKKSPLKFIALVVQQPKNDVPDKKKSWGRKLVK